MRTETEIKSLIAETVNYYVDPSKVGVPLDKKGDGPTCQYITAEGNMCAVGRCLIDPQYVIKHIGTSAIGGLIASGLTGEHFKEEYRGFRFALWRVLQIYHDQSRTRNGSGILTEEEIREDIDTIYKDYLAMDDEWVRKYLPNLTL
jgi:hypothetical protein